MFRLISQQSSGQISAESGLFTFDNLEKSRKLFDWLVNPALWLWLGFIVSGAERVHRRDVQYITAV